MYMNWVNWAEQYVRQALANASADVEIVKRTWHIAKNYGRGDDGSYSEYHNHWVANQKFEMEENTSEYLITNKTAGVD